MIDNTVLKRKRTHARPLTYVRVHVGPANGGELTGSVGRRSRRYRGNRFLAFVVVFDPLALFFFRERGAEVGIELAIGRRRPRECPAQPLFIFLQLRERRPRNRPEHHVVVGQVNCNPVEAVRDRRAGRTPRRVVGPKHEMIDKEL